MPENPLPDFSRRQWTSAQARSVWEPRITSIGQQWAAAERASVENGIRSAALQSISPEQLCELSQRAASKGLVVTPLSKQGRAENYAASVQQTGSGAWDYRVVLSTLGVAGRFVEAWRKADDETIGQLLGYPECCRRFFAETWGNGSVDPTWSMADHGDGPLEANILLRWLGVRYVPHLPCGFRCDDTFELGRKFRELIPKTEREWMDELLSMPMLWSSLNGIGEVVTPIVTLNFRTDVNHELCEIRRLGEYYPEAGAHGLRFPYRPPAQRSDERLWKDNGFFSHEAMQAGHEMIISALGAHVGNCDGIIDLGAGNGELLRKLGRGLVSATCLTFHAVSYVTIVGVESDAGRADRRVWPGVRLGRIQDAEKLFPGKRFAVAIISVRRFEELSEEDIKKLRAWLEESVDRVLVYQYEQPQFAYLLAPRDVVLGGAGNPEQILEAAR